MEHVYLFYFFVTFSIGILSLGIVITTVLKTRERFVSSYLVFYFAFSLIILAEMFLAYIQINVSTSTTPFVLLFESLASLGTYLLLVAVPACTHALYSSTWLTWRNGLFAAMALGVFLLSRIADMIDALDIEQIESLLLLPVVLYSFLYGIWRYRAARATPHKVFAQKWLLLLGCSCPLLFTELLMGGVEEITVSQNKLLLVIGRRIVLYPVVYWGCSALFTWHFIKYFLLHAPQTPPKTVVPLHTRPDNAVTVEHLCEPYHLSPREKEVLLRVLHGESNAQIKEALYISLGTVKAHVSNIYQKVGVKSRYELLSRFRDAPLPSPHKESDS